MADLMADDRHQFVVVHQVHQGAEYADRTVAAGEGIDIHDMVDLEVERQSVDLGDPLGQPLETCAVFGRFVGDGVVGIHPFDRFAAQLGNVLVAQCHGFGHVLSRFEQFPGVEFPAADFQLGCGVGGPHGAQKQGKAHKEKFFHFKYVLISVCGFFGTNIAQFCCGYKNGPEFPVRFRYLLQRLSVGKYSRISLTASSRV